MMRNTVKVKSVFFAAIVALTSQVNAGSWHEVDMSDAGEFDTQCDYRTKLKDYGEEGSVLYSNEVNPFYLSFHAAGEKEPVHIFHTTRDRFCNDKIKSFSLLSDALINYYKLIIGDSMTSDEFEKDEHVKSIKELKSKDEEIDKVTAIQSCLILTDESGDVLKIEKRCN